MVAFGGSDGTLGVLNLKNNKAEIFKITGHNPALPIISVCLNNSDQLLASVSSDGFICVRKL